MTKQFYLTARISLSFLWVFTGIASGYLSKDVSYDILSDVGVTGDIAALSIYSGSLLDIVVGIWLLTGKALKFCYGLQIAIILAYSVLLTILAPNFWLHPFGPITKNIPLLVLIYYLYCNETT